MDGQANPANDRIQISAPDTSKGQDREKSVSNLALIDELLFFRSAVGQALLHFLGPDVTIHPFSTIEEAARSPAWPDLQLIVLFTHRHTETLTRAAMQILSSYALPILIISDEILSDFTPFIGEALQSGICGFLSTMESDFKTVPAAISFVADGGTFVPKDIFSQAPRHAGQMKDKRALDRLTPRQTDVFRLLRQGKPNKLIAHELNMSQSTVKIHVRAIMQTIGATNRTQAVFKGQKFYT